MAEFGRCSYRRDSCCTRRAREIRDRAPTESAKRGRALLRHCHLQRVRVCVYVYMLSPPTINCVNSLNVLLVDVAIEFVGVFRLVCVPYPLARVR
ncbi:hypothetical protein BaRGS_00015181 [Batillaria attramentaria]|uniref:Uncharacterized protein n=1 Tax=Batillaria attramentaria TaxID=370345 RepID=A0ABD0L2P6_9CAEN